MTAPMKTFGQRTRAASQDPYDSEWLISVGERTYGPYTGHQMCSFHKQGRLAAHSMVSRRDGGAAEAQWHTAASDAVLGALFRPGPKASPTFGQRVEPGASKFVLIIELKGRQSTALENAIVSLGRTCRIAPNIWLLSGSHTVTGLRNMLSQHLGPGDWLLVIDANHARTAGYNMGPENDSHVRYVWQGTEA